MEHKLHLYTGEGKGKTTAAMGLALRALGHGERVLIAQFLKDGRSGELLALRQFPTVNLWKAVPMKKFLFRMSEEERAAARQEQTAQALALAATIAEQKPSLIVLDELALALARDMLEECAGWALLDAALASGETAVTGRSAPGWLREKADYVSVILAEKHPYATEGLPARKGVEW